MSRETRELVHEVVIFFMVAAATVYIFRHRPAEAAYMMSIAIFLRVTGVSR